MRVFVVGATGYVGTAVCEALRESGHGVIAAARSEQARDAIESRGDIAIEGDVRDPARLAAEISRADGVIYAVQLTGSDSHDVDAAALTAIGKALHGSNKPFIYTSGCWYYGSTSGRAVDENAPPNPPALVKRRPELEAIALDVSANGVRATVIRPGIVYGRARGIPAMLVQSARERGFARYIGDGSHHWPVVHVEDLGALYALALERARSADIFNAADQSTFTMKEIAEAASEGVGAGGKTEPWPLKEAEKELGAFAEALALDQILSTERARKHLGWQTRQTTIVDDLARGSYVTIPAR